MLRREAAGRRFQTPPWQSRPLTRATALLSPVKEPIRLHQQANKSAFLGLGMLTRLQPPACGAVPARRAPNLPDVRRVAGDGGGPPYAGHLPAPATAVTALPVRPRSTLHGPDLRPPPATALTPLTSPTSASCSSFHATDISDPLSARRRPGVPEHTLPPHHHRRPEQDQKLQRSSLFSSRSGMNAAAPHLRPPEQQNPQRSNLCSSGSGMKAADHGLRLPTLRAAPWKCPRSPGVPEHTLPSHHRRRPEQKPERIDLFGSGTAMLQLGMKTAVPHLRPSACHAVPARRALDLPNVRRVAAGSGSPTSTGPLPAGHRPTPATPPQVSPSVGRLFNFHGTPWSGRHLNSPVLRRHLQSSVMGKRTTNRLLSTNPEPVIKDASKDEISSSIEDAVERIAQMGGNIQKLGSIELKELLQQCIEECKDDHSKKTLKRLYYKKIRPALVARVLLSPYQLDDNMGMGVKLLEEYKSYASDAKYLTSLDLMEEVIKMAELHWSQFLDFLSEEGCLIVENWEHSLNPSFGITFYKRGVTFDGSPLYRGECDASYDKETKMASICIAIWSSTNEILSSILVKDYQCKSSVEAEAIAMFLLLNEGIKLGLHEYPFEACSDCDQVFGTLWGSQHIGEENAEILKLLKYLRRHYKCLIPEWQQREKMFWVDGIMRVMKGASDVVDLRRLLKKMKSYLSGKPVFKFTQKPGSLYSLIKKIREESKQLSPSQQLSPSLELHDKCQMEVEEKNKTEMLSHIITALRPSRVYIVMKSRPEARSKILEMYKGCVMVDEISDINENYRIVILSVKHWTISKTSKKDLWIGFDSGIPEEILFRAKQDSVTVFLRTPNEVVDQNKLPELSPITFMSLHNTPSAKKSPHPLTRWTQRSGKLFLVIELPKAKDIVLDLKPEGYFHFSAKGDDDMPYKIDLELYDAINLEEIKEIVGPTDIRYILKKADVSNWWPRLLKKEGRPPVFLKLHAKLDIQTAASDVQNDKNEVVNKDKEVQSGKNANEDVEGSRVEQSKGEQDLTGAAKEEKP